MGLSLLPPEGERLWTLNAVRVPDGRGRGARATATCSARFNMEVGAGLGPLAGKIWRVGLMGHSSSPQAILLFLGALESVLAAQGHRLPPGAGTGGGPRGDGRLERRWGRLVAGRSRGAAALRGAAFLGYVT